MTYHALVPIKQSAQMYYADIRKYTDTWSTVWMILTPAVILWLVHTGIMLTGYKGSSFVRAFISLLLFTAFIIIVASCTIDWLVMSVVTISSRCLFLLRKHTKWIIHGACKCIWKITSQLMKTNLVADSNVVSRLQSLAIGLLISNAVESLVECPRKRCIVINNVVRSRVCSDEKEKNTFIVVSVFSRAPCAEGSKRDLSIEPSTSSFNS